MNNAPDINTIYEKMYDEKLRFTDNLVDEIIEYIAEDIPLSDIDVRDLAIYTLYSIVVLGTNTVASPIVKKSFCDIIGDSAETINYLGDTLNSISTTDDAIADELYNKEFCSNTIETNVGLGAVFGGDDDGES